MSDLPQCDRSVGRGGFTLLEMLLAIALVAIAGSMFLVSVDSLGRSSPADEFEGAFWRAMAQARERALATRREVELGWDDESRSFVIGDSAGTSAVPVEAASEGADSAYSATFSEEVAANDFILVRGALVTRRPVPAVRVFPDGSCQSFAVEFSLGEQKHLVVIDPWTGAPMLQSEDSPTGGAP